MSLPKPFYEDANGIIYHGRSELIVPFLPKFDLLHTDPPYGIGADQNKRANKKHGNAAVASRDYGVGNWDSKPPSRWFLEMLIEKAEYSILWGGNFFKLPPMPKWLVWNKKTGDNDYADCELAWTNLPGAIRMIEYRWAGMLQEDIKNKEVRYHPTQKPLSVMLWAMQQIPDTVKTVLDPFGGSHTIARAAKDLGLHYVSIDENEKYCEDGAKRLQQECLPMTVEKIKQPEQIDFITQ